MLTALISTITGLISGAVPNLLKEWTAGGVHGSPKSATFGVYPCGYSQDIYTRLSRELQNYKLIIIAKGGSSYGTNSTGWVNPHNTLLVIEWNDGVAHSMTVNFTEHTFNDDWSEAVFDINKLSTQDMPPASQVTRMEVRVYLTDGAQLGYVGIHEADTSRPVYHNPLL